MRKLKVLVPAMLVAGLLLVWGVQFATSAPGPSGRNSTAVGRMTGRATPNVNPNVIPTHTAPVRTYFNSNSSVGTITNGAYAPVGNPITVVCPGTTGKCKIEIEHMLQVGGNTTAGNYLGFFEQLDGSTYSSPGGPYSEITSSGGFQVLTSIEAFNGVSHGTHTIQPLAVTSAANMTGYNFSVVIRVYKP
jgi:hypothetical protein